MTDAYYDDVVLLLPMRGDNNGTAFPDYSPSPKTITVNGDAKTVTAQSKYYGSSAYFDGTGDYLEIANNSQFSFGSGDFTIEAWVRLADTPGSSAGRTLVAKWNAATNNREIYISVFNLSGELGIIYGWSTTGANGLYEHFPWSPSTGTWYHVAISRSSGTVRCFVDGEQISTSRTNDADIFAGTAALKVGLQDTVNPFNGHMQDLRITNGAARYTDTFTPPIRLFGAISGTILDVDAEPVERTVRIYGPTGALTTSGLSDSITGAYELYAGPSGVAHTVVASGEPDRNDLILSGVEPA